MKPNPRPWMVPALAALRTYWLTGLMLAGAGALGVALLLPIASLSGVAGLGGPSRLLMWVMPGAETGLHWSELARNPTATGQVAIGLAYQLLLVGAGFALAVAGLTIVTFAAVREGQREVELSVRRAVGASKRMLLGAAGLESAVLILGVIMIGGALGTLAAALALRTWPGMLGAGEMGASLVAVAAIGGGILFGAIVPVLFARRRVTEAVSRPIPLAIPALQLGLSLAVLTAGSLVSRHAIGAGAAVAPAADGDLYRIDAATLSQPERSKLFGDILHDFHAAGVETTSLASAGTAMGLGTSDLVITNCGNCFENTLPSRFRQIVSAHLLVSADTFRALNIRLVAGRLLTDQDRLGSQRVVVVNRAMAAENFEDGQALGRELRLTKEAEWYTVVGVVDDPARAGFGSGLQPRYSLYLSVQQQPPTSVELITDRGISASVIQSRVTAAAGRPLAVSRIAMADLLALQTAPFLWLAKRFALTGWGMLVLAAAALLALMRLWIASLESELGVRRALGASRARLWRMVIGRTAIVGIAGTAVGLWFGPAIWVGLGQVLPGLPRWDLALLLQYALLLMSAAAAGALVPAYLALRRTPAALIGSHGS